MEPTVASLGALVEPRQKRKDPPDPNKKPPKKQPEVRENRRVPKACDRCHKHHQPCGTERPCPRCAENGWECTDTRQAQKRGFANSTAERILGYLDQVHPGYLLEILENLRTQQRPGSDRSHFEDMVNANLTVSRAQANTFRDSLLFREFRAALSDDPQAQGSNLAAQDPVPPNAEGNAAVAPFQDENPPTQTSASDDAAYSINSLYSNAPEQPGNVAGHLGRSRFHGNDDPWGMNEYRANRGAHGNATNYNGNGQLGIPSLRDSSTPHNIDNPLVHPHVHDGGAAHNVTGHLVDPRLFNENLAFNPESQEQEEEEEDDE